MTEAACCVLPSATQASILALRSSAGMQSSSFRLVVSSKMPNWNSRQVVERIYLFRQEDCTDGGSINNLPRYRQDNRIFHYYTSVSTFAPFLQVDRSGSGHQRH